MRVSGAWQAHFASHRQLNLTERVNLQSRNEFFNLFNHPTLGNAFAGLNTLYQIDSPSPPHTLLTLTGS
jgi:hypothetical protein